MWWWESTIAARKIGIAAIGVFGSSMGEMQVHITLCLIMAIIVLTAVVRPFGEQRVLQFLELGTLMATWMTLWAGTVFNANPKCEDGEGGTIAWCETLSVLVGLFDIAMVLVVVAVVVYLTKQKECDACCGRVKDDTVGQRRRDRVVQVAEGRRSRMDSAEVTSMVNPTLEVGTIEDTPKLMVEMTVRSSTRVESSEVTTLTNPRLDLEAANATPELSIERTARRQLIMDRYEEAERSQHESTTVAKARRSSPAVVEEEDVVVAVLNTKRKNKSNNEAQEFRRERLKLKSLHDKKTVKTNPLLAIKQKQGKL